MARNEEPLVREQAVRMAQTIIRHARLSDQLAAMQNSAPFLRLAAFFRDFDRPLVESTLRNFEPAVPATIEGVVFAGAGFLAIYFFLRFRGVIFWPRRRHRHVAERA